MYFRRKIEGLLKQAIKQFPVCLITGSRQSGKSTLLTHALPDYTYVTLDDPLIRQMANEDPELFLEAHKAPLIIDEIQYAPKLFSYLKIKVDKNRRSYGQYILTGSQTFQVMEGVTESLAGRIAIFHLYPFSWEEIDCFQKNIIHDDLKMSHQMIKGFYPESFVTPDLDSEIWYSSYLMTYIQRDIRNIQAVKDLGRFQTFLTLLAARAGQLLNLSEVAKECGITHTTARSWLSILESTYIIYLLKPFHSNLTKRVVKSPKIYFVDTGLLCFLLGIDNPTTFMKGASRGHVFENMVVMEHVKRLSYRREHAECFFYRSSNQVEVDLIIQRKGGIEAYEIKFAKTISKSMSKSLALFAKDQDVKCSAVLSLKVEEVPLQKNIIGAHWSSVG